jgi:putative transposase
MEVEKSGFGPALRSVVGAARVSQNWSVDLLRDPQKYEPCPWICPAPYWNYQNMRKQFNQIKDKEFPWNREVPERALRSGVERAFNAQENHKANPKHFDKPSHRGRGNRDSATFDKVKVSPDGLAVAIPKVGYVPLKEQFVLPANCRFISMTVRERAGRWFVSFQIVEDGWVAPAKKRPEDVETLAAIDFNIGNEFAAVSVNGQVTVVENPRFFRRAEKKLRRLQQKAARRIRLVSVGGKLLKAREQSKNYEKAAQEVSQHHMRIANQRKDFQHKFSTTVVKSHDAVLDDQNISVSSWLKLNGKSVCDVGIAEIRRQIAYKCELYGTIRIPGPGRFEPTSRKCVHCDTINPNLKWHDESWWCASCGAFLLRNPNAARVLEKYGWTVLQTQAVLDLQTSASTPMGGGKSGRNPSGGSSKPVPQGQETGCVSKVHIS